MSYLDRESDKNMAIYDKYDMIQEEIHEINEKFPVLNKSFYISMNYEEINAIISTSEQIIINNANNIIVNKVICEGIRCIDVINVLINENFKPENEHIFLLEGITQINKDIFELYFDLSQYDRYLYELTQNVDDIDNSKITC
jgi:hypothetical protein